MAKNTTKTQTQEQEKQESGKFYLSGVVTTAMFGKRSFTNGKKDKEDKYRISVKCTAESIAKLKEAAEPFYVDTEEKWLPDWMTKETSKDGGYINLSSSFSFRVGEYVDGAVHDCGAFEDFLADQGGNINGSKVVVFVTIKPGAIYPAALLIKELVVQDIGSMFEGEDFEAAFGDELPFT